MKIAIFGESPADEEALTILVTAILGQPIERPSLPSLRARGYTQMADELPRVIRALHYNSDAAGLVVVIDSNGKAMHSAEHEAAGKDDPECRLCVLRGAARRALANLKPHPGIPLLRVAVGMAVPTLEAWLLLHREAGMNEANWKIARQERPPREPHTRVQLKELAYGTAKPSLELETQKMVEYMTELVKDIPRLQTAFPGGFTPLLDETTSWKTFEVPG